MNECASERNTLNNSPCTMVRNDVASIDDWITKGFILIIHAYFGADAPPETLRRARFHFCKVLQIIFNRVIAMCRSNSIPPFLAHLPVRQRQKKDRRTRCSYLGLFRVVGICLAGLNDFDRKFVDLIKIV